MKRTLSLVGLLVLGILLLFNPDTGLVTAVAGDVVVAQPTTTTGQPPPTTTPTTTGEPPATDAPQGTEPVSGSVLGASVPTEFGPFQVEIAIAGGEIVDIVTISEPTDRKSRQINDYVIPLYEEAVISTQSADIDAISGATITWDAYTASIQSAMDEAGI